MTEARMQEERLYLIKVMLDEVPQYNDIEIPDDETGQWRLLRSLFNVRPPYPASSDFLKIQDEYLSEMIRRRGIVDCKSLTPTSADPRIYLWKGDITTLRCDAIVNAANSALLGCWQPCHSCIDNAIHSAAGIQLRAECSQKMNQKRIRYGRNYEEPTGQAMLTKGYNLPAEYVIHTVGPIVYGPLTDSLRQDLRNCYESVMNCCVEHGIRSVAFCCISTGEFHFPNEEAAKIAVDTVTKVLKEHGDAFDRVIFNVFKNLDLGIYQRLLV